MNIKGRIVIDAFIYKNREENYILLINMLVVVNYILYMRVDTLLYWKF